MNDVRAILKQSSGKLSLAIEAMQSGPLSEESQTGLLVLLSEVNTKLEFADRLVNANAALAKNCLTSCQL
jgi:methylglyoxal synthase